MDSRAVLGVILEYYFCTFDGVPSDSMRMATTVFCKEDKPIAYAHFVLFLLIVIITLTNIIV